MLSQNDYPQDQRCASVEIPTIAAWNYSVDSSGNMLGDEGAAHIREGLKGCPSMMILDLGSAFGPQLTRRIAHIIVWTVWDDRQCYRYKGSCVRQ